MKAILSSFRLFLSLIVKDSMLVIVCIAPVLSALAFFYGIPAADTALAASFGSPPMAPYYGLLDLLLAVMTPYLFCFASAMVMLEEADCGIGAAIAATPVGKSGYIVSRLIFPALFAAVYSFIVLRIFSLSGLTTGMCVFFALSGSWFGILVSLLITAFSSNKVEGMALSKLGGFIMLGLPVPFFVDSSAQYLAAFLPSFWLARSYLQFSILNVCALTAVCGLWYAALYGKFARKIM